MPRTRIEIQKDILSARAGVYNTEDGLNDPVWINSRHDPRYIQIQKAYVERINKLRELERELAEAKYRGERGRAREEIEREISEAQSLMNTYSSTMHKHPINSPGWFMGSMAIINYQSLIKALNDELND